MLRICVVRWRTSWARLRIRSRKARSSGGQMYPCGKIPNRSSLRQVPRIAEIVAVLQTVVLLDRRGVSPGVHQIPRSAVRRTSQYQLYVDSTTTARISPGQLGAAPSRSAQDRCATAWRIPCDPPRPSRTSTLLVEWQINRCV